MKTLLRKSLARDSEQLLLAGLGGKAAQRLALSFIS